MSDFNFLASGILTEFLTGYGFQSHPNGAGPMIEFTCCSILPESMKVLFPAGLAFEGKISNYREFFDDLTMHPARWELHFDFETRTPFLRIIIPALDSKFTLAPTVDNCWECRYVTIDTEFHPLEIFELKLWSVPDNLTNKTISIIKPEVFGRKCC